MRGCMEKTNKAKELEANTDTDKTEESVLRLPWVQHTKEQMVQQNSFSSTSMYAAHIQSTWRMDIQPRI